MHIDFLASEIPDFVTIPVGELQSCFTTESIQDDSESQEPDESFTLRITPRDNEVVGGTTTTTEVTIIDDDGKINRHLDLCCNIYLQTRSISIVSLLRY